MERISNIACAGVESLKKASQWTQHEVAVQRQRLGGSDAELRPRKRVRRSALDAEPQPGTGAASPRSLVEPTVMPRQNSLEYRIQPTPLPTGIAARQGIVVDTEKAPSAPISTQVTFATNSISLASDEVVNGGGATAASAPSQSVVVVTATPSASAAASGGISTTTEAIIIACSIAGALIVVTLVCLVGICYRKKKRRQLDEVALQGMPQRKPSSSTLQSDGWRSESSEPEKQSLISSSVRSRSVSPASRGPSPSGPVHVQQRSLGGYKPFMDTILEQSQPPSPTSIYTKRSPPQPTGPGQLQLNYSNIPLDDGLHSPLKPPPLRIRQGSEGGAANSTLLPSPKNMFSAVRLPFMSGASNNNRRSSAGQSLASSYDEERGMAHNRRTMESETLPAARIPGKGYRDSFWSVAASSIMKNKGFQSSYGDSLYGAPSSDLRHTRTNSTSSGGHSRTASSALNSHGDDVAGLSTIHGRARSHSSVYSQRRPSEALIPALPPMPSQYEIEQKTQGHKSGLQNQSITSVGSQTSGPPGDVELKGRLHSVDFWAREERDMRLGTFAPAELEGSTGIPTAIKEVPTPIEMPTPRDSSGMVIGAAMGGTPRHSNPYFAGAVPGAQGGYSLAVQGGDGPVRESTLMPQGYSHENTDDGRRLWNRGRSRDRSSEGRSSSGTAASVFKQHPGDMVMI